MSEENETVSDEDANKNSRNSKGIFRQTNLAFIKKNNIFKYNSNMNCS